MKEPYVREEYTLLTMAKTYLTHPDCIHNLYHVVSLSLAATV